MFKYLKTITFSAVVGAQQITLEEVEDSLSLANEIILSGDAPKCDLELDKAEKDHYRSACYIWDHEPENYQ